MYNSHTKSETLVKINGLVKNNWPRKLLTTLTKDGALLPVLLLESTVTGGRTIQAQKRGGIVESRERFTEEFIGAIFWLFSMKILNKLSNVIAKPLFNIKEANFDSGNDAVRNPLENVLLENKANKKVNANSLKAFKFGKVALNMGLSALIIGFLVPKFNQKLTKLMFGKKDKEKIENAENVENKKSKIDEHKKAENKDIKGKNNAINNLDNFVAAKVDDKKTPTFKGAGLYSSMAFVADKIENNTIGQLLSSDVGIVTGRTAMARNNDERLEIFIRDAGSIYFYLFAISHAEKFLNLFDKFKGKNTNLDPKSAGNLTNLILKNLEKSDGEMSIDDFKKKFIVEDKVPVDIDFSYKIKSEKAFIKALEADNTDSKKINLLLEKIKNDNNYISKSTIKDFKTLNSKNKKIFFDTEIIKLDDFIKKYPELAQKAKLMSDMQPETLIGKILTRQQVRDILSNAEITKGKFLFHLINEKLSVKADKNYGGALKNKYRYISQSSIEATRDSFDEYLNSIVEFAENSAKKKGTVPKITEEILKKANKRNLSRKFAYFGVGFAFASAFLSTLIPKFQYWVTKKRTGTDKFPGIENVEIDEKSVHVLHKK